MEVKNRLLILAVLRLPVMGPGPLTAQGSHPELAGHTFVPSTLLPDPFVDTYLSSVVGLGQAFDYGLVWPILGDDTLFTAEGELTWVTLDFGYRQRVTDWLALGGRLEAGARVGTNCGVGDLRRRLRRNWISDRRARSFGEAQVVGAIGVPGCRPQQSHVAQHPGLRGGIDRQCGDRR